MRFFRLSVLAAVLFFGVACAQEKSKSLPVKPTEDKNIVFNCVDKEAVFSKGGIDGFRNLFLLNTDLDKIDRYEDFPEEEKKKIQKLISENKPTHSVMLSTTLSFIIEPDGTMSNVLAEGENESFNKEMERVVKEDIKDKWIPAEVKGKKVRSYYKMPIRMRVE